MRDLRGLVRVLWRVPTLISLLASRPGPDASPVERIDWAIQWIQAGNQP